MKNYKLLLLLLLSISDVCISQKGWIAPPTFTSMNLYDCKTPGLNYNYISSDSGTMFRSPDGGVSWIPIRFSDTALNKGSLKYLYGGGNDDMYAVGDNAVYGTKTSSGNILAQVEINAPFPGLESFAYLFGIFNYSGLAAAGDDGKFYIKDGANWRKDTAATRIARGRNINYSSGYFFVGDSGLIMKADSIGFLNSNGERVRWKVLNSGTTKNLNSISVIGTNCIAVGDDGTIIKSTNSGENWMTIQSPVTENLYAVWLNNVYLICGAHGTVLRCYDFNSNKWYRQFTPADKDLYFIKNLNNNIFISGGEDGVYLKTTDGGGSLKTVFTSLLIEGSYNPAANLMKSDTILVSLRESVPPYSLLETEKGIVNTGGNSPAISFSPGIENSEPYYIQINHRNSIETWSQSPQIFSGNQLIYNFYLSADKAYGNNQKQIDALPVRFGLYSGDADQEGHVDLSDVILVYNDASNFINGYKVTDMNGDNVSDLSDLILTYNNSSGFAGVVRP